MDSDHDEDDQDLTTNRWFCSAMLAVSACWAAVFVALRIATPFVFCWLIYRGVASLF